MKTEFNINNFSNHKWVIKQFVKGTSYKCNNCLTYIFDSSTDQYDIFVLKYYGKNKLTVRHSSTNQFSLKQLLNDFKKLTCSEIIIKSIIE